MQINVGDVYYTNNLTKMIVVKVDAWNKIEVRFEGLIQKVANRVVAGYTILKGSVKTPYCRSVFGVGYLGEGPYKVSYRDENNKIKLTDEYLKWSGILKRCYDEEYISRQPTYQTAIVCNDWHNFQVFAEWCQSQKGFGLKGWQLDKDMHIEACKIYSPDFCSFIPKDLNSCFLGKQNSRIGSRYVPGVFKYDSGYRVDITIDGKFKTLGYFPTEEEAYGIYSQAQTEYADYLLNKYSASINDNVKAFIKSFKPLTYRQQKEKMIDGNKEK